MEAMLDATEPCGPWNAGKCAEPCQQSPPEKHQCNGKIKGNKPRACGAKHRSKDCNRCMKR